MKFFTGNRFGQIRDKHIIYIATYEFLLQLRGE